LKYSGEGVKIGKDGAPSKCGTYAESYKSWNTYIDYHHIWVPSATLPCF
jgi:hypothetical protein